jgi:hypothetical protein
MIYWVELAAFKALHSVSQVSVEVVAKRQPLLFIQDIKLQGHSNQNKECILLTAFQVPSEVLA